MSLVGSEFNFTDSHFEFICERIKRTTGIHLTESKRNLVYNRLASRLRKLGLSTFNDYFRLVDAADSSELEEFVNAITTNVTSFFREPHHFDFLGDVVLPGLLARPGTRRIRIWSAGCSLGMEPYSIAMVALEAIGTRQIEVEILGTDLDTKVLQAAADGVYDARVVQSIPEDRLRRFALRGRGAKSGLVRMRPELQRVVSFRHLNLMEPWPFEEAFDVIFCRNVVIYFDKETQIGLWSRFWALLPPGGHLFVGHSESMMSDPRFSCVGRTIYQKGTTG